MDIFTALDEQTVTVPGTEAAALIVPSLAASLTAVLDQRSPSRTDRGTPGGPASFQSRDVHAGSRRQDRSPHPHRGRRRQHLPSRRPPRRLRRSRSATRSSGSSIRGEQPARRGNKQLKRAFFPSLRSPPSPTRHPGPTTTRRSRKASTTSRPRSASPGRRADALFAMLRDSTLYKPQPVTSG